MGKRFVKMLEFNRLRKQSALFQLLLDDCVKQFFGNKILLITVIFATAFATLGLLVTLSRG